MASAQAAAEMAKLAQYAAQPAAVPAKELQAMQEALHFASTTLAHSGQVGGCSTKRDGERLIGRAGQESQPGMHSSAVHCRPADSGKDKSSTPAWPATDRIAAPLNLPHHPVLCYAVASQARGLLLLSVAWQFTHSLPTPPTRLAALLQVPPKAPEGEGGEGEDGEAEGGGVGMGPNSMPFVPTPDVMMLLLKGYAGGWKGGVIGGGVVGVMGVVGASRAGRVSHPWSHAAAAQGLQRWVGGVVGVPVAGGGVMHTFTCSTPPGLRYSRQVPHSFIFSLAYLRMFHYIPFWMPHQPPTTES